MVKQNQKLKKAKKKLLLSKFNQKQMTNLMEHGRSPRKLKKRHYRKRNDNRIVVIGSLSLIFAILLILFSTIAKAGEVKAGLERLKMEWEIREEIVNEMKNEQRELHAKAEEIRNGIYLGDYRITTYYTPLPNQTRTDRNYYQDLAVNCQGDCLVTASGYRLSSKDAFKIMACPPEFEFGTNLKIKLKSGNWKDEVIYVTCEDRGGAIKGKRLDLWTGSGDDAHIGKYSGTAEVWEI